jgi:hypothetical protein
VEYKVMVEVKEGKKEAEAASNRNKVKNKKNRVNENRYVNELKLKRSFSKPLKFTFREN